MPQSSPREQAPHSHPFEAAPPGREETAEERAKLQLRSAAPDEWEQLLSQVEQVGESETEQAARKQREAEEKRSEDERSRLRQETYEVLFLKTMRSLEQDPSFQALSDPQKLAKTAEAVYPQAYEIFHKDFPNQNPDLVGGTVIAAYGNFVINNIQMDPFKRVEALKAGDLMAKRIVERRKEAGLISMEEPDRSQQEDFQEIRFGHAKKELTGIEEAERTEGEEKSMPMSTGMTLEAMKRQDAIRRLQKLHEEAEQLRATHTDLKKVSDEDIENAFGRIQRPPAEQGN